MLLVFAAGSRNESPHHVAHDPCRKAAPEQETGEAATLYIGGVRDQRTHPLLGGDTTERFVVDLLLLRDGPNGGVHDRAGNAFAHQRLTYAAGPLAAAESRCRFGARHVFVVEQPEFFEANDGLLDESGVRLHLAQPLFELAARTTRSREHAQRSVETGHEPVRIFEAKHGGLVELDAFLERGRERDGVRVDEPLPTVNQSHPIAPGPARVLGHPLHDAGSPGRKKSRGATHNEPW